MPTNIEELLKILYPDVDSLNDDMKKKYAKDVAFLEKYFDKFTDTCELHKGARDSFTEFEFYRISLDITKDHFDPETIITKYLGGMLEFMDENAVVTNQFDTFMDVLRFEREKENEYKDVLLDETPIDLKTVFALTEEFLGEVDESGELLAEFIKLKENDGIVVSKPEDGARSIYQENKVQYVFDGTVNTANTLVHEFMHHWCDLKGKTSMDYYKYTTLREYLSIYYENAFIRFMDDKGLLRGGERPLLADRFQKDFKKDPDNMMIPLFELAHKLKVEGEIDKDGIIEVMKGYSDKAVDPEEVWEKESKKLIDFCDEHYFGKEIVSGFSAYRFCTGLAHYTSLEPKIVKSMFKLAEHVKDGEHDPIFLDEYLKTIGQEEFRFPPEVTPDMAGAERLEKVISTESQSNPTLSVEDIGRRTMPATTLEDKNFVSKIFGRWKEKFLERMGESRDDK